MARRASIIIRAPGYYWVDENGWWEPARLDFESCLWHFIGGARLEFGWEPNEVGPRLEEPK